MATQGNCFCRWLLYCLGEDRGDPDDRDQVLVEVGSCGRQLRFQRNELQADREVVLTAVGNNGRALEFASQGLRADRDVVSAAVSKDVRALEYASDELRANRELVQAAAALDAHALQYADESLQSDRSFVLAAVTRHGEALEHASEELQEDREVVLAAVGSSGGALAHASEELQADPEVVQTAVRTWAKALQHASDELRTDEDFVLLCARSSGDTATARVVYYKARDSVRHNRPWDESFLPALTSRLAAAGQKDSPVVSVTLTRSWADADQTQTIFRADAMLVSGREFACDIATESRSEVVVVNDLADKLLETMRARFEIAATHIFITFRACDDDWAPVRVWDHDRSLVDFLYKS